MPRFKRPSASTLWRRSVGGLAYLGLVALVLSGLTGRPVWLILLGLVFGAFFSGAVALVWLVRWALRQESRVGQFSIASLLLVTALAAAFFGAVRWLVTSVEGRQIPGRFSAVYVATLCVFLAGLGIPVVLYLMEAFVWLAAWLVWRPTVQRWLKRKRRGSERR